jgi:hypothetical protein
VINSYILNSPIKRESIPTSPPDTEFKPGDLDPFR